MSTLANPKLTMIPVAPIGADVVAGFVDYADGSGAFRNDLRVPRYPDSPNGAALRKLRIDKRLVMRDAAAIVGISGHDYCGIESGRLQLSESDWAQVRNAIASVKGRAT